jgi:hypothetical protein
LRLIDSKQVITGKNKVVSHKFWQYHVLQRVLTGKSAFSGLALGNGNGRWHWIDATRHRYPEKAILAACPEELVATLILPFGVQRGKRPTAACNFQSQSQCHTAAQKPNHVMLLPGLWDTSKRLRLASSTAGQCRAAAKTLRRRGALGDGSDIGSSGSPYLRCPKSGETCPSCPIDVGERTSQVSG